MGRNGFMTITGIFLLSRVCCLANSGSDLLSVAFGATVLPEVPSGLSVLQF